MTTAGAPTAQATDVVGQIVYALRTMGVAPIPRNYQLFYEAYIGSNGELTQRLAALGSYASQEELDALAAEFLGTAHVEVIERAHGKLTVELEGLLRLLQQEQRAMEGYTKLLGETATRINSKANFSNDIIRNAITLLTDATGNQLAHGERTVDTMAGHSQEMDQVRRELDEYKRIANTDSLTRLANRRAFDEKLAALYDAAYNLEFGQSFIERMRSSAYTGGQLPKVIASYNAGPLPVGRWAYIQDKGDPVLWIESIPFWETRYYVPAVMRNLWVYEGLARREPASLKALAQHRWPAFPAAR